MALPPIFENPGDFFEECVAFFREYKYLFNVPNTDVLVEKVFNHIDLENLEYMDVFDRNFELPALNILNDFFFKLERLKPFHNQFEDITDLENSVQVPLSPKKRHEIVYLAKEVKVVCERNGCDVVVDFGCGLGYLDQIIFETSNLKVLGLECNTSHYVAAKKRQSKYHPNSTENVKYIKHEINDKSHTQIEHYLNDKFLNFNGFCVTGLHACADLTVVALDLFLKMEKAMAMVIMPCCYHKMEQENCRFKNFPLSHCFKEVYERENGFEFMGVPFLRLGAQPPCLVEDNLKDSVFNLLARAVLQLFATRHDCKLKRKKRKACKTKFMDGNFENYIQDACTGFSLAHNNQSSDFTLGVDSSEKKIPRIDSEDLRSIWRENSSIMARKKAAIFILLQNCLQPIIENLILYDRIVYLKEKGLGNCKFKRIVNERISPRCYALLASKQNMS